MNETKLSIYTKLIYTIGTIVIIVGILKQIQSGQWMPFLFFTVLSAVAESLIIPLGQDKYVSIGFAIGMAAILIFDPWVAAVILTLGTLLKVYRENEDIKHLFNTSFRKSYFNGCAYAIQALAGGMANQVITYFLPNPHFIGYSIAGIVATFFGYVLLNMVIYTKLFSIIEGRSFRGMLREQIWCFKNFAVIAPLGILMMFSYSTYGWFFASLIFGPLLLARYSFILYVDMKTMYVETIKTLSNALDAKDEYTNGHSQRVAHYSVHIAEAMMLPTKTIETIETAALLHDIGKIGISDIIINKPGQLDFIEYYEVKRHPEIGSNILKDVASLKKVARIIRSHHERYDGNGYPDSLLGEDIPLESAIIAVADAYDAMTSDRSYRKSMPHSAAVKIIISGRGTQFHPDVVDAFTKREAILTLEDTHAV